MKNLIASIVLILSTHALASGELRTKYGLIDYSSLAVGDSLAAVSSAILDVKSTTKGVLLPRMTTTQKNAISSPAVGLLVFDTVLNSYSYWNGSAWAAIGGGGSSNPITLSQLTTPSNPTAGSDSFYFKSDDLPHWLTSSGLEFSFNNPSGSTVVYSNSTGAGGFVFSNGGLTPVLDSGGINPITATILADGGDVEIGLMDDGINEGIVSIDETGGSSSMELCLFRDGSQIRCQGYAVQNNGSINIGFIPPSSFRFLDTPSSGSHSYTVQVTSSNPNRSSTVIAGIVLYARRTGGSSISATGANQFISSAYSSDGTVTSTYPSFSAFSPSLTYTFTPSVSGTYKVYSNIPAEGETAGHVSYFQIANTGGSATAINTPIYNMDTAVGIYQMLIQSVYMLNAGTSYTFTVQGASDTGIIQDIRGDINSVYMFAELVTGVVQYGVTTAGTFGSSSNAQGASISTSTLTLQPADGTHPGGLTSGSQTIGGAKTFSGALAGSGGLTVTGQSLLGQNVGDQVFIGTSSSTAIHSIFGGYTETIGTQTSNYTMDSVVTDRNIYVNSCSGGFTVVLSAATNGRQISIIDVGGCAGTNNVIIDGNSSETINGSLTLTLNVNNGSVDLSGTSGTGWNIR